MFQEHIQNRAR